MAEETTDLYLSSDEESYDEEDIVMQGLRRSRNRTNWLYRGTAMTTTDRMDIQDLRTHAFDLEDTLAYIGTTFAALAVMAKTRAEQSLPITRIRRVLDYLCQAVAFITCAIELTNLNIEDRLYFVHNVHRFKPHNNRKIADLEDDNHSTRLFGFKKQELFLLLHHLRIPSLFREDGYLLGGEESLLIFLYYIRSGMTFTRMADSIFGGDPRRMTNHVRAITDHLYHHFYHKITGDSMRMWLPCIAQFRSAIWEKLQDGLVNERYSDGSEMDWEIWLPEDKFRVFGWLDDTDLQTDRPRPGRSNESEELRDTQEAFYK